jgi:hypothetical protein
MKDPPLSLRRSRRGSGLCMLSSGSGRLLFTMAPQNEGSAPREYCMVVISTSSYQYDAINTFSDTDPPASRPERYCPSINFNTSHDDERPSTHERRVAGLALQLWRSRRCKVTRIDPRRRPCSRLRSTSSGRDKAGNRGGWACSGRGRRGERPALLLLIQWTVYKCYRWAWAGIYLWPDRLPRCGRG